MQSSMKSLDLGCRILIILNRPKKHLHVCQSCGVHIRLKLQSLWAQCVTKYNLLKLRRLVWAYSSGANTHLANPPGQWFNVHEKVQESKFSIEHVSSSGVVTVWYCHNMWGCFLFFNRRKMVLYRIVSYRTVPYRTRYSTVRYNRFFLRL